MKLLVETASPTPPEPVVQTLHVPAPRPLPWWTWGALAGVLAAEVLALTLRFDSAQLLRTAGLTAWLLGRASFALSWAIAAATAALLWRGPALLAELRARDAEARRGISLWALACHLVAMTAFAVLSGLVFEGPPPGPALGLAWLATGLLALATLGVAALPLEVWLRLARRLGIALPLAAGLGVLALVASAYAEHLWVPYSRATLAAVEVGLRSCAQEVVVRPSELLIGTTRFKVQVSPSCSGYGGMALGAVFIGLFLWRERTALRFPRALVLLPAAIVLAWLANVVRIVLLILIGSWWWPEAALGGFHSQAGWIGLLVVTLGMMTGAGRSRWLLTPDAHALRFGEDEGAVNRTAAYIGPLMALLAGALATRAFSHDFDLFYPLRLVPAVLVLWYYRRAYTLIHAPGDDVRAAHAKHRSKRECVPPLTPLEDSLRARLGRTHSSGAWMWPRLVSWKPIALGVAAYGLWLLLSPAAGPEPPGPWNALPPVTAFLWVIARVIGAAVIVPLAEELAFRGYLMRRLIARDFDSVPPGSFTWLSFLLSSVAFGVLHERWLAGIVAGLLYAVAVYCRRRLSDAVVAHAVTNALLAVHVLVGERWSLWV
jgi:exosortase/archaeosortase family protein